MDVKSVIIRVKTIFAPPPARVWYEYSFAPGYITFCAWLHQFLRLKCKMAAAADIGFVLGAIVVAVGPQLLVLSLIHI